MQITTPAQMPNRFVYIDMLKGFGILAVVVAHVLADPVTFNDSSSLVRIIYMFHMPLFFFITGYLSSIRSNYQAFFVEKFKQLIIPYFVYFVIVFALQRYLAKDPIGLFTSLVYGGRQLYGYLGVFWFVPCLFMTQQFTNYLLARFTLKANLIIISACLLVSYLNHSYLQEAKFPYNANVVFAAAPFYFCGYLFKNHIKNWRFAIVLPFAALGLCLTVVGYSNYVDMKNTNYGIIPFTFFSGLALIIVLIAVFKNLPFLSILSRTGKASLTIMYLHQPIQLFIFDNLTVNPAWRIGAGVVLPMIVFMIAKNWSVTRALLLGSKNDLNMPRMWLTLK
jgi:fucose 4-O-acetylase-like acetyltransferase